jgi:hypothetical protein
VETTLIPVFVKLISYFLLFFCLYIIILHRSYDVSVLSLRIWYFSGLICFYWISVMFFNLLYWTSLIVNRYYLIYFQVVRIVIRNRMAETNQLKGFVELRDSSDAANVISVLNGANIYDDCCTLEVRLHHFCHDFLFSTTYSNLLNSS